MTHPNPTAPGNVPLWRCRDAYKPTCHFSDTCVFVKHQAGFKVGQYANCHVAEIVGFRLPPRCEDCEYNPAYKIASYKCAGCRDMKHYTPRQPGKEKF